MDTPELNENQFSVLIAEYSTGHVLKKDLTFFLVNENPDEVFQVFEGFESAKEYVLNLIKIRPDCECVIMDFKGAHVASFDRNGKK